MRKVRTGMMEQDILSKRELTSNKFSVAAGLGHLHNHVHLVAYYNCMEIIGAAYGGVKVLLCVTCFMSSLLSNVFKCELPIAAVCMQDRPSVV